MLAISWLKILTWNVLGVQSARTEINFQRSYKDSLADNYAPPIHQVPMYFNIDSYDDFAASADPQPIESNIDIDKLIAQFEPPASRDRSSGPRDVSSGARTSGRRPMVKRFISDGSPPPGDFRSFS